MLETGLLLRQDKKKIPNGVTNPSWHGQLLAEAVAGAAEVAYVAEAVAAGQHILLYYMMQGLSGFTHGCLLMHESGNCCLAEE